MDKEMLMFQRRALLGEINGQPLCGDYKAAWRKCGDNKEKLVSLALTQQALPFVISSCNRNIGVPKEYILQNYSEYINGNKTFYDVEGVNGYSYGLYVGYSGIFTCETDVLAIMWSTNTHCTIQETKAPVIYVGCSSHIHLSLDGYNSPMVYLFDNSSVDITCGDEESKVTIYRYSQEAQVNIGKYCLAQVKTFDKELKL